MLKKISGHAAKSNMRLVLWCIMVAVLVAGGGACVWHDVLVDIVFVWCMVGAALSVVVTFGCAIAEGDKRDCLADFNRPPVMFEVLRCAGAPASWLTLALWLIMLPGEIAASFILWQIVFLVKALANPMPGNWE